MPQLVPVEHDPFAAENGVKLTPVDHDPFANSTSFNPVTGDPFIPEMAQPVNRVASGIASGMAQRYSTPGAAAQPNPYPPGSEEASWYDDQREQAVANWGPQQAFSMMGAGTPFAKPGAAGVFGGKLTRYDEAFARGEITKAEYEGFKAALPPDETLSAWNGNEQFPNKDVARVELNRTTRAIDRLWKKQQEWAEGGPKLTDAERTELMDAFKRKQRAQEYLTSTQQPDFDWLDAYPEKQ